MLNLISKGLNNKNMNESKWKLILANEMENSLWRKSVKESSSFVNHTEGSKLRNEFTEKNIIINQSEKESVQKTVLTKEEDSVKRFGSFFSEKVSTASELLTLSKKFDILIEDAKKEGFSFNLKCISPFEMIIMLIKPSTLTFEEGKPLGKLQKELKACLKSTNLEYNKCEQGGKHGEILTLQANKEVIAATADALGEKIGYSNKKYTDFFKGKPAKEGSSAQKEQNVIPYEGRTITCPMQ